MDQSNRPRGGRGSSAGRPFHADDANEKRVDAFLDRVKGQKRGKISDKPRSGEGVRLVTTDDVFVYKREDGKAARPQRLENGGRRTEPGAVRQAPPNHRGTASAPPRESLAAKRVAPDSKKPKPPQKTGRIAFVLSLIGRIVLGVFCLFVIAGSALAVVMSIYLVNQTRNDDQILNLNNIELSYATILGYTDTDEATGAETFVEYQRIWAAENRVWVKYQDIPQHLIDALVASEDQRFWEHQGVDWFRTIGAFVNEYVPGIRIWDTSQGGSTIVQQLIKNITDEDATEGIDGALRKLREIYRALILEKNYSREQILEAYFNTFRLGGTVAGIEAAANYYFGKSTGELSVAEGAAIICITKAPGAHNPFNYPEANRDQRETMFYQMHQQGYLSNSEYRAVQAESDAMIFDAPKDIFTGMNIYSYFTETVIDEVLKDLVNILGWDEATVYERFASGGYRVEMTIDPVIQSKLEEVALRGRYVEGDERRGASYSSPTNVDEWYIWPYYTRTTLIEDENGEPILDEDGNRQYEQPQAAMVVLDMKGQVKGIVGGLDEKTTNRGLNRAVDSTRSTGSSMKPLAGYGPGILTDAIHFSTLLPDQPFQVINGRPWPENYSSQYGSPKTVAEGIAASLNTTAVWTLDRVGIDFSFNFMKYFLGMDSLVDTTDERYDANGELLSDRGPSLVLGGITDGISPLNMAAAYVPFGNGGYYYTPHSYTRIVDAMTGEVILNKTAYVQEIIAYDEQSAYIMNRLLRNVTYSGLGGTGVYATPDDGLEYVGKSGTQSGNNDFWFIGMNPYYVMSTWQGLDQPDYQDNLRPHPIQLAFREVMGSISEGLEYKDFPVPQSGVERITFCRATGDIASEACPDTRTGYYKTDGPKPTVVCNHAAVPAEPPA